MVLHKSEQHGNDHLFLRFQLFACIRFVGASQHKQVVNYWLQSRDGFEGKVTTINFLTTHMVPDAVGHLLTMSNSFPATCHDAVTKLNDLWDTDDLLGVVTLIRQEHQEEKDVGNDCF